MGALLECVAVNSAVAAVLAAVALASRALRRPALTHALWVLVLARLVAWPVWTLELPRWPSPVSPGEPAATAAASPPAVDDPVAVELPALPAVNESLALGEPIAVAPAALGITALRLGLVAWAGSAAAVFLIGLVRVERLRRALRDAVPADPAVARLTASLARRIGLTRVPEVAVVPARVSPCVWAFAARPMILLPRGLLETLAPLSRAAVLLHELAHVRRGDHWVRRLEFLVTAVFWWHPVVWLARRELRAAEELCCDWWVVATLPAARRAYADALVDTADFLNPVPALPPLACGLGEFRALKRRLHMILRTPPAGRPGRSGVAVTLAVGLLALPLGLARSGDDERADGVALTWEDEPPLPDTPRAGAEREARLLRERALRQAELARAQNRDDSDPASDARATAINRLRDELRQAQQQAEEARTRIERLERTIRSLSGADAPRATRPARSVEAPVSTPLQPLPPEAPQSPRPARAPVAPRPPGVAAPIAVEVIAGERRRSVGPGADGRLEALERQLELLRREMTELRRDLLRRPVPGTPAEE
jgi:beta-lactamase regulating signal transducer with metallopeptidase domain